MIAAVKYIYFSLSMMASLSMLRAVRMYSANTALVDIMLFTTIPMQQNLGSLRDFYWFIVCICMSVGKQMFWGTSDARGQLGGICSLLPCFEVAFFWLFLMLHLVHKLPGPSVSILL